MAKYAQGFERKNTDTKNLIILAAIIVGVVCLTIGFVVLYNKVLKKEDVTFASEQYEDYYLTNYSKLLSQKAGEGNYYIYVCSKTGTSDSNMTIILEYIDKYEEGKVSTKLFLLDYDNFDSTSDTTETTNSETIKSVLNVTVQSGYLIAVVDNELLDSSSQVTTDTAKISKEIKSIVKGKASFEELYK